MIPIDLGHPVPYPSEDQANPRRPQEWRKAGKDPAAVVGDLLRKHTELAQAGKFKELETLSDKILEILGETAKAPDVYGQE